MQILRAADRIASPWKNGGGVTYEIAAHPAGASLSEFDWRVSTAIVATDGPFSCFEEIDRTLLLIAGAGMELQIGDGGATLTPGSEPLDFAGDAAVSARLPDGPITDLNVMVRRGRLTRAVRRCALPWTEAAAGSGVRILVVLGLATLRQDGRDLLLEPYDAALLALGETALVAPRDAEASLVRIELTALAKASTAG